MASFFDSDMCGYLGPEISMASQVYWTSLPFLFLCCILPGHTRLGVYAIALVVFHSGCTHRPPVYVFFYFCRAGLMHDNPGTVMMAGSVVNTVIEGRNNFLRVGTPPRKK